ncbi:hypothetical protein DFP91_5093 [Pseudorhodoplanes sinuspersici]|nr:hypothetical protein DFP91_5093 [Pseudorhodoplanes sinuspersici]
MSSENRFALFGIMLWCERKMTGQLDWTGHFRSVSTCVTVHVVSAALPY